MCIFGGFLFLLTMQFSKPYKSIADQLARMEERRLIIDLPREQALAALDSITYYRFTGYALAFLDKTIVSNEFASKYGPLAYLEAGTFASPAIHQKTLAKIQAEFARSKQPCAEHFRAAYDAPPLWALADVTTFGSMSMLMKGMKREDQNAISSHYGMRGDYLASYMQHATVLRNLCAHHCRVFDFPYSRLKVPPQEYLFKPLNEWRKAGLKIRTDRPLLYQVALLYRLRKPTSSLVFDREAWRTKICAHFKTLPRTLEHRVRGYIDFPTGAETSALWV
jgi:abortive infection bacteriophage resistance protein